MTMTLKNLIFGFLALSATLVLQGGRVVAQNQDQERLFTVYDVAVDVRAGNATEAKQIALRQAEDEAFTALIHRLVPAESLGLITLPEDFSATPYVLGVEVEDERNSRVRYIGKINVTFDPEKLEDFLTSMNVPFVAFAPPETLVFPLYWSEGNYVLWGEKNLLWPLWEKEFGPNRLNRFILPKVTALEKTSIGADQIMDGRQPEQVGLVMAKNNTDRMMGVGAKFNKTTAGQIRSLDLTIYRPLEGFAPETRTFQPQAGEDEGNMLSRALNTFFDDMDADWKLQATTQVADVTEMALMVPTDSPGTWAEVKRRLSETPIVSKIRVARLAIPDTYIAIEFSGTQNQLALALRQKGLILVPAGRGYALIRQEDAARYLAERGEG